MSMQVCSRKTGRTSGSLPAILESGADRRNTPPAIAPYDALLPAIRVAGSANIDAARCLFPRPIVDRVLVGRAWHRHVPFDGPVVRVVEPLARIGLRRSVQQPPRLQFVRLKQAAGLGDQVMR